MIFNTILEQDRSKLDSSQFGIPEDRKYPLDTEEHVRSAIKLFGHAEESKKRKLARNIKKAADRYGMDIPETTQVYKYLNINEDFGFFSVDDVNKWLVTTSDSKDIYNPEQYSNKLEDAIDAYNTVFDYNYYSTPEIFCMMENKILHVGRIGIYKENSSYAWLIKHQFDYDNLQEYSMASMNPIVGIHKPFILKIGDYDKSGKEFLGFSTDIISSKYLTVNEDYKLEVRNTTELFDKYVEIYEFKGNNILVDKIAKTYAKGDIVNANYIYETLSCGKELLTFDQIDYDSDFKKVDFDLMRETMNSNLATLEQQMETVYNRFGEDCIFECDTKDSIKKYNVYIKEDINGYYYYNNIDGRRTRSVNSTRLLTENMLKSIIS